LEHKSRSKTGLMPHRPKGSGFWPILIPIGWSRRAGRRAPLQGFTETADRRDGRRRRPHRPHKVTLPLGAISDRRSGSLVSPPPPRRVTRPRGLPSIGRSRAGARDSSRRLGPLSGHSSAVPGPGITAETIPSWGSSPLRRHGRAGSLNPGVASPGTFRPRGFSPPRRFAPRIASRPRGPLPSMGFMRSTKAVFGHRAVACLHATSRCFAAGFPLPQL
jgi:hypothetical protein